MDPYYGSFAVYQLAVYQLDSIKPLASSIVHSAKPIFAQYIAAS